MNLKRIMKKNTSMKTTLNKTMKEVAEMAIELFNNGFITSVSFHNTFTTLFIHDQDYDKTHSITFNKERFILTESAKLISELAVNRKISADKYQCVSEIIKAYLKADKNELFVDY